MPEQNLNPDAKQKCVEMLLEYSGTPMHHLYEYPHRADDSDRYIANAKRLLDQILETAALPAQPDTVNSVDELKALPARTVIMDSVGEVSVVAVTEEFMCNDGQAWTLDEMSADLPATVLYRPVEG